MSQVWAACGSRATAVEFAAEAQRIVESQEQVATQRLVGTLAEQDLLEAMLERSKPPRPQATDGLDYLLATPFRYPPLRHGSRFGRREEPALFYASCTRDTLLAEAAYYRFVFWQGMVESPPTRQIQAVPGGRGEMMLGVRYDSENDGFSFANNETVRANDAANDLYFVSVGGVNYLASPTRLDGFQRSTTLLVLPYSGSFEEVSEQVMAKKPEATEERVIVADGDWILLRTADGAHTLLNVRSITGATDDDREITLFYAYCPLRGRLFF